MVELTGQVEDLAFQLTNTQEELRQALDRVQQAEVQYSSISCAHVFSTLMHLYYVILCAWVVSICRACRYL